MTEIAAATTKLVTAILELEKTAAACRRAQKAYFKDRTRESLVAAKQAEAELDKLLRIEP